MACGGSGSDSGGGGGTITPLVIVVILLLLARPPHRHRLSSFRRPLLFLQPRHPPAYNAPVDDWLLCRHPPPPPRIAMNATAIVVLVVIVHLCCPPPPCLGRLAGGTIILAADVGRRRPRWLVLVSSLAPLPAAASSAICICLPHHCEIVNVFVTGRRPLLLTTASCCPVALLPSIDRLCRSCRWLVVAFSACPAPSAYQLHHQAENVSRFHTLGLILIYLE